MKRGWLLLGWTVLLCPAYAQERAFTLQECVDYALEHRTEVAIGAYSVEDAGEEVRYNRLQQLPDLSASFAHSMNWGRSLNMEKYEWEDSKNQYGNLSLSSSVTLFAGFQLRNRIKASKLNALLQKTALQKVRDDIRLEVIQAFYEAVAAEEQKRLSSLFYESDVQQERKARQLDSLKRMSLPDLLEIAGQTRKALLEKKSSEKQWHLALLNLKKCMNYQEDGVLTLCREQEVEKEGVVPEAGEVYAMALTRLPELRQYDMDSLLLRNQWKQLRGNFSPTLSVSGLWYSRYQNRLEAPVSGGHYSWWEQVRDNNYKQVGIALNIPLFNRQTVRRQMNLLKTEMATKRLNKRQALADVRYEIEQLCLEASNRRDNLWVLEAQEANDKKIYELRQVQYQQGKLSVYDLLTAETNWKNSRITLELERYNLRCYLEMLKIYMGMEKL